MFDSDLIDGFSRTPWWAVPLLWIPASLGFFTYGVLHNTQSMAQTLGVALIGVFCWPLAAYGLHGVHHDRVRAPFRLVMTPTASLVLCVLFGWLFYTLLGPIWSWSFFGGFVFGYVIYDVTHYGLHHSTFKNPMFLKLKKHHLLHHHSKQHSDRRSGVSTTLWDHLFRTY